MVCKVPIYGSLLPHIVKNVQRPKPNVRKTISNKVDGGNPYDQIPKEK